MSSLLIKPAYLTDGSYLKFKVKEFEYGFKIHCTHYSPDHNPKITFSGYSSDSEGCEKVASIFVEEFQDKIQPINVFSLNYREELGY